MRSFLTQWQSDTEMTINLQSLTLAGEYDEVKAGTYPGGLTSTSITGATAAFKAAGDTFWVKDTVADGRSAATVWLNYLAGNPYPHRIGVVRNKLGSGHWGYHAKDFAESSQVCWRACTCDGDADCKAPHCGSDTRCISAKN
jgi:hypothetical protein